MTSVVDICQQVFLPLSAHDIYETLLDSRRHSILTGLPCTIDRRPGGDFQVGENMISGTLIQLVPDERIVQSWEITSYGWPPGHSSRLAIELTPTTDGTIVSLEQTSVPADCESFIRAGWHQYYWKPLGAMERSA